MMVTGRMCSVALGANLGILWGARLPARLIS